MGPSTRKAEKIVVMPAPVASDIVLPERVRIGVGRMLRLEAQTDGKYVRWHVCSKSADLIPFPNGAKVAIFSSPTKGTYEVMAWTAKGDTPSEAAVCVVEVTDGSPDPGPGPKPPDPKPPDPKPPTPGPVTGLRILMVKDSRAAMSKGHLNVWNSTRLKSFFDESVAKTGGRPDWRKWGTNVDVTYENQVLKDLWAATKPQLGKLPALVIVSDQRGEILPLPATEQGVIDAVKKYQARARKQKGGA